MPEIAKILLAGALGMLIATTGIVLGWVAGRRSVAPRLRGYDPHGPGEETVEIRISHPESAVVAAELAEPESEPEPVASSTGMPQDFGTGFWPVKDHLRTEETVRVKVAGARVEGAPVTEAPWAWLTRNGDLDRDRACLTRTQEQRKLDGVSG